MQKINGKNTALAIFLVATAVVLIGGLALVPTTMQSASANHGGAHGAGGGCGVGGGSESTSDFLRCQDDDARGADGGLGTGGTLDSGEPVPGKGEAHGGHGDGSGIGFAHCGGGTGLNPVAGENGGGSCDN
jgi:hypothetical protein